MKTYYHVTQDHWGESVTFTPRVPESRADGENDIIPRVCFAPLIENCLFAISWSFSLIFNVYSVQEPFQMISNEEIVRKGYVCDADETKELWAIEPVTLKYQFPIMRIGGSSYNNWQVLDRYIYKKEYALYLEKNGLID